LTAFLLKILDNVSSSGNIAGIAASSYRGSTLNGNKVSNLYEYFKQIFVTIPEIFGPPLVNVLQNETLAYLRHIFHGITVNVTVRRRV
jgi:hypothetical protein